MYQTPRNHDINSMAVGQTAQNTPIGSNRDIIDLQEKHMSWECFIGFTAIVETMENLCVWAKMYKEFEEACVASKESNGGIFPSESPHDKY